MAAVARPDWLADGSEVAILGRIGATPGVVARATPTQVIVKTGRGERRFRMSDLRPVGVHDSLRWDRLVPPDDHRYLAAKSQAEVSEAMRPLIKVAGEAFIQYRIGTKDREQAVEWATRFRDAAQAALDALNREGAQ